MSTPPITAAGSAPTPSLFPPSAKPYFLAELFCGRAVLSQACGRVGLAACGIGFHKVPLCSGRALCLDLSLAWAQSLALELIKCTQSAAIAWITPPSGTLSRARDRPIKSVWASAGVPAAPPLRSCSLPEGLSEAKDDPRLGAQLRSANVLVHFCFRVLEACKELSRPWYVVNPANSYLWDFGEWQGFGYVDVNIAQCAYGGPRPNPLRIRCCNDWLVPLRASCPGGHAHLPWRPTFVKGRFEGFGTAQAKGLPLALAAKIAEILKSKSGSPSCKPEGLAGAAIVMAKAATAGSDENKKRVAKANAAASWQSRGRRLEQVVGEYRQIVTINMEKGQCAGLTKRCRFERAKRVGGRTIPKDSQVLAISTEGGFQGTREVTIGIPWTPLEFFAEARKVVHPFAGLAVPKTVALAVFECVTKGPSAIKEMREAFFRHWEKVAKELEPEEKTLAESLHEDVRPFATKKRPLLTRALLRAANFPAADLVFDFITRGAPMFGRFPPSGVFPRRLHEASVSVEQLTKAAKWARPALLGSKVSSMDAEAQKVLWEKTLDEIERKECKGPFTAEQLDERHPGGWISAKRFGVPQKGSWRAVDDYSIFGQNASSHTEETVDTDGPDEIIGTSKVWARALQSKTFILRLDDGTILQGTRHEELDSEEARALLARIIDLERAYKQMARPPHEAHLAIFALMTSEGEWQFFESTALGFGARNAVFGFNLPARAIRHILNVCLWVPATHFFDDYSQIDAAPFSDDSCRAVERLLDLLGWSYKNSPEDLKPAAAAFSPLGVAVDLSTPGVAVISNTPKRKAKILTEANRLCDLVDVPSPDVQALIGVCQYSEAQTSGRTGALALRAVRRAEDKSGHSRNIELKEAIRHLAEHVQASEPRCICLTRSEWPVILLTDASFDGGSSGFGAIIFDPRQGGFEFFGGLFTESTIDHWQRDGGADGLEETARKEQIICQAELAVVPMAFRTWPSILRNREVLVFVDNEPAKDALINGISASWASAVMVRETRRMSAALAMAPWFDRVASPSNLADDPSRGRFQRLLDLGAARVAPKEIPELSIFVRDM